MVTDQEFERYQIRALQKALDIMDCFTPKTPELTLTDLQKRLDMDKTNIYRILVNLEYRGILRRNPETGKFRLSLQMLRYSQASLAKYEIRDIAKPFLQELSKLTGETVVINTVQGLSGICIERINSENILRITAQLGQSVPLLRGASGKVLAAYLEIDKLRAVYEKERPQLTASFGQRQAELQKIRTEGYAISYEEIDPGTFGVSFPIFCASGEVRENLSVMAPMFRCNQQQVKRLLGLTQQYAMMISHARGYLK